MTKLDDEIEAKHRAWKAQYPQGPTMNEKLACRECLGPIVWAMPSVTHDGITHPAGPEQPWCNKCEKFVIPCRIEQREMLAAWFAR